MEEISSYLEEAKILSCKIKKAAVFFTESKHEQTSPVKKKRPRQVVEDIKKDCESIFTALEKIQISMQRNEPLLTLLSAPSTPQISNHQRMESLSPPPPPPPNIKPDQVEFNQEQQLLVNSEKEAGESGGGKQTIENNSPIQASQSSSCRSSFSSAHESKRNRDFSFWLQGEPEMDQVEHYVQCLQKEVYNQEDRLHVAQRCASKFLKFGHELSFEDLSSLMRLVGEAEGVQLQLALGSRHLEGILNQLEYRRLLQRAVEGSNRLEKLRAEAKAVTQSAGMFTHTIKEVLEVCQQLQIVLGQSGLKDHMDECLSDTAAQQDLLQIQHTALAYYILLKEPHFMGALDFTLKEIKSLHSGLQGNQPHTDLIKHTQALVRSSVPFLQRIRQRYIRLRQRFESAVQDQARKDIICPICLQNELSTTIQIAKKEKSVQQVPAVRQILPTVHGSQCKSAADTKNEKNNPRVYETSRSLPTLKIGAQGSLVSTLASPVPAKQQISNRSKWKSKKLKEIKL